MTFAGLINLFQPNLKTLQTFLLWVSFVVGILAFIHALKDGCSWYAGFYIFLAAIILFLFRYSEQRLNITASLIAIFVGVAAFYTRLKFKKNKKR